MTATPRPILILTASAGAGHLTAAEAVCEALRESEPDRIVEVCDVLQWSNRLFRFVYAQGYLHLAKHWPTVFGWIYDATDRPAREPHRTSWRRWLQNLNSGRIARLLCERNPALIVNTHFLPAEIVGQLRTRGRLDCPQVTVTTDFETHRLWVQPPTERYYTATNDGRAYLRTWDVPEKSIVVSGIPIRSAFRNLPSQRDARRRLDLPEGCPLILVLSGGFGVGPTGQILRELMGLDDETRIAVVTGRNPALHSSLEPLQGRAPDRVRLIGFTDQMHAWMRAADVVVTKPGGLTTAEALCCGLPMVIVNPIPGQETRNSDFLLEQGAAIKVNNLRLLRVRIEALLSDPKRLAGLAARAVAIAQPNAAGTIAADVSRMLAADPAPPTLAAAHQSAAAS